MEKRIKNSHHINVFGAREHNLKNIDVTIPKEQLTVITGPSGSGKSSLALDVLYTEGKRRYMESLSSYARQFLGIAKKPDVDRIEGLCPSIAIEQKTVGNNPRSTVGTITEIYDYLRVFFARVGISHCPQCKQRIQAASPEKIMLMLFENFPDASLKIAAPIAHEKKGEFTQELQGLFAQGHSRFIIDGTLYVMRTAEDFAALTLKKTFKHSIDVIIDAVDVVAAERARIQESIEKASTLGKNTCKVMVTRNGHTQEYLYSSERMCLSCKIAIPELEPRIFSFNSPIGACKGCNGLGVQQLSWGHTGTQHHTETVNPYALWYQRYGAESLQTCSKCLGKRLNPFALAVTVDGKDIHTLCESSIRDLLQIFIALELDPTEKIVSETLIKEIVGRLTFLSNVGLDYLSMNRQAGTLSGGEGQRIRLATQIGSGLSGVLYVLDEPSIGLHQRDNDRLIATLKHLRDQGNTVLVVEHDMDTMEQADYIIDMGPAAGKRGGAITATGTPHEIKKNAHSLSGAFLSGKRTIARTTLLRTAQNSFIVRNANLHNLKNLTVNFPLGIFCCVSGVSGSGKSTLIMQELVPRIRRELGRPYGERFAGSIVSETMAAVPGEALVKTGQAGRADIINHINEVKIVPVKNDENRENNLSQKLIENMIVIDQSPIGLTPRSNPATYLGIFDDIRKLFAGLPQSNARGYVVGHFSFNVPQGRCAECTGDGTITVSMHFLPDVVMVCKACKGKRYSAQVLEITYREKNIADILLMTAAEALDFFAAHSPIAKRLKLLCDVGLDYLQLGQPSTTLSGGEAQRIKLVDELAKRGSSTLYILDEPTTGLHASDIEKLLEVLNRLVDKGNSIIVIEHNLDVLKTADYIIDLGPEGGNEGGFIVAQGTPEEIMNVPESHTGVYLKKIAGNTGGRL